MLVKTTIHLLCLYDIFESFGFQKTTLVTREKYPLKNTHDLQTGDIIKVVSNHGAPIVVQPFADYVDFIRTGIKKEETFFTLDPYFRNSSRLRSGRVYTIGDFINNTCERSVQRTNYYITEEVCIA
jgi:hypothetical protein